MEGKTKWYASKHEVFDEKSFPEIGEVDAPPCFTNNVMIIDRAS